MKLLNLRIKIFCFTRGKLHFSIKSEINYLHILIIFLLELFIFNIFIINCVKYVKNFNLLIFIKFIYDCEISQIICETLQ